MIHFERSTTIEKGGQRDCSDDGNVFYTLNLEHKNLTFNEDLCRWKPEFFEIKNKNTFLHYKNILLGQTPNITTFFSSIIKDYDCIIEIGYHRGGLSLWLNDNKKNNCNLYCFDISDENRLVNDNINFIVSDCLLNKTISQIKNIIQNLIERKEKSITERCWSEAMHTCKVVAAYVRVPAKYFATKTRPPCQLVALRLINWQLVRPKLITIQILLDVRAAEEMLKTRSELAILFRVGFEEEQDGFLHPKTCHCIQLLAF